MDYNSIFTTTYEQVHNKLKTTLIERFKSFRDKKRPFNTAFNSIVRGLSDNKANLRLEIENEWQEAFKLFNERYRLYEGSEAEIIRLILENELLSFFSNGQLAFYREFIEKIAMEMVIQVSNNHLQNYYDHYSLIYHFDKYEYFSLKDFDSGMENAPEFIEMRNRRYPKSSEDLAYKKSKRSATNLYSNGSSERIAIERDLSRFEDKEKLFLIYVMSNDGHKLPKTEFFRLLMIVRDTTDYSFFENNYSNTSAYKILKQGLDYWKKREMKLELLDSLISKLSLFHLPDTNQILKMKRTKVK